MSYTSTSEQLQVVVLAAGEGTRMRSSLPKVLHPICGTPMLGHVLNVASALQAQRVVVVLAASTIAAVRESFGDHYMYVVQHERLGTGHAVLQARPELQDTPGQVLVLYGDSPLIKATTAQRLIEVQRTSGAKVTLLSFQADPPTGYGRVVRDADGHVQALVEERDATAAERAITEVNSGVMCFDAAWLWQQIEHIPRNPVKQEYYLTDLAAMAVAQYGPGATYAMQTDDPLEAAGANDRAQLAMLEAVMRQRLVGALMAAGVTVVDPATTYVEADVIVASDTTIYPATHLQGRTTVGQGCVIGPHVTLRDADIGDGVQVRYAVVEGVTVAPGALVGPFVHLAK